jgi:hypothetical protein
MPSKSVKQAKTMSAIAHGWRPKGKAAGIPVQVAREFHAADVGKTYGPQKGTPMPMKSQPKPREGAGHVKQPQSSRGSVKTGVAAPHRVAVPELMAHGEGRSEGKNTEPVAGHEHGTPNFGMAAHHQRAGEGGPHRFPNSAANNAHGFGHGVHVRSGALRMSGAANAHRVGHRGK